MKRGYPRPFAEQGFNQQCRQETLGALFLYVEGVVERAGKVVKHQGEKAGEAGAEGHRGTAGAEAEVSTDGNGPEGPIR